MRCEAFWQNQVRNHRRWPYNHDFNPPSTNTKLVQFGFKITDTWITIKCHRLIDSFPLNFLIPVLFRHPSWQGRSEAYSRYVHHHPCRRQYFNPSNQSPGLSTNTMFDHSFHFQSLLKMIGLTNPSIDVKCILCFETIELYCLAAVSIFENAEVSSRELVNAANSYRSSRH